MFEIFETKILFEIINHELTNKHKAGNSDTYQPKIKSRRQQISRENFSIIKLENLWIL